MFRRDIALSILTLSMDEVGGRHHAPSTVPRERGPIPIEENVFPHPDLHPVAICYTDCAFRFPT